MAKYNRSTMGSYLRMLKEDIKEALQGKVEGAPASKEECDKVILSAFDEAAYHLHELAASNRALNRIMEDHGCKLDAELFQEYIVAREEERYKYNDYKHEGEEDDD